MRRFPILAAVIVIEILFCCPLFAQENSTRVVTEKTVLDNGLTVLTSEMPSSSVVSVNVFVKAGSVTEGEFLGSGISHFLEHMLFKGTERRGVGEISSEIQALGGDINATTSFDYTTYYIDVPKEAVDQALDVMSDMVFHSVFDTEELEKEREVVYGEMRMRRDQPAFYHSELIFRTAYVRHPYSLPVIGFPNLLAELKREDFVNYYRRFYVPNNMILSIAGNFRKEDVLPKVEKFFGGAVRQPYPQRVLAQEPAQISSRRYHENYATELTRLSITYQGVGLLDSDVYALDVLSMLLGNGESSRLYLELFKNKKLVRTITASNWTPVDRGLFEVESVLDAANVETVVEEVKAQIRDIQQNGVTAGELEKAKRQVLSQYIRGQQTTSQMASSAATDEAYTGDQMFSQKYVDEVGKVTLDDIQRVAKQYLQEDRENVVVLYPPGQGPQAQETGRDQTAGKIEKIVLDNGLTVLLRENHTIPLVAVSLAMNGGTRFENPGLNGLSELTARLWTQGTKTRSADEIAKYVESLGMSLGGFSGRNSMGLRMTMLSQDRWEGLELLSELIREAAFPDDEFQKEKERLLTAIIARDDSIGEVTMQALQETLFSKHSFRMNPLGTRESVGAIRREDVVNFYQMLAAPNNMVISIFGDFDEQDMRARVKALFGGFAPKEIKSFKETEPPPNQLQEKMLTMDKQQAMLTMGFQGCDMYSPDRYGLEVLAGILGSSFSGRMFTRIRDQGGQAYTLGGSYMPAKDTGMVSFYVLTTEDAVPQVRKLMSEIIEEVRTTPVSDQELADIKSYLKGSFQMDIETDSSLGYISTLDELYGLGSRYLTYADDIDKVTKEDIQRLVRQYLDMTKAVVVITTPAKPSE